MWPLSVKRGLDECQNHHRRLGGNDDAVAVEPIGNDPAERSKDEYRNLTGEAAQPEQRGGPGQPVNQPRLGHHLHPGADERYQLTCDEQPVVRRTQRAERNRNLQPINLIPS